ncbi:hypothetical protein SAMN05443634_102277 [Chishuiella changwenlii]|uniref:Toxin ETX/toxin MTX2 n=2 Tax=Chishuiella changwenlii TaxID=1434701 RepID=A0A1M6UA03_9FLAO|nr:hypothetical protein [Chishuiella changwenlii]GGE99437.1 hypothetical protein GCM10010984_16270 [Chishuiella changwenlii]SHK65989.1 hypothetical protein SAMN05443634_102277 [Chishuiella changwenlii]
MRKFKNLMLQNVTIHKKLKNNEGTSTSINLLLSKKTLSKVALTSILLLSVSCANDDNSTKVENHSEERETPTKPMISENFSDEEKELLKKGWTFVNNDIDLSTVENNSKSQQIARNQQRPVDLTIDHLKDIGFKPQYMYGRTEIKNIFAINGTRPDGVRFNNNLCIGKCDDRNTTARANVTILTGEPIVYNQRSVQTNNTDLILDETIENAGRRNSTHTSRYDYKQGHKSIWKKVVSGSVKVASKFKVGIPLFASKTFNVDVTVGGQTEDGGETYNELTVGGSHTFEVPSQSKVNIKVFLVKEKITATYKIPVYFRGATQTNFPSPANGHYFWRTNIDRVPEFMNKVANIKEESGSIEIFNTVNTRVWLSPSSKL